MKSNPVKIIINLLSFLAVILVIFTLPIILLINVDSYFINKFNTYNVYENFDEEYSRAELNEKFSDVIYYLNSGEEVLDREFFSREDIIHLVDVKNLVGTIYLTAQASIFIIFFITLRNRKKLTNYFWGKAGILSLIIIVAISLSSLINFDQIFIGFHELVFNNDYWLLDPTTSNLIKFLPQIIFENMVRDILLLSSAISTILIGNSIRIWHKTKTQDS